MPFEPPYHIAPAVIIEATAVFTTALRDLGRIFRAATRQRSRSQHIAAAPKIAVTPTTATMPNTCISMLLITRCRDETSIVRRTPAPPVFFCFQTMASYAFIRWSIIADITVFWRGNRVFRIIAYDFPKHGINLILF
jgi:hypothetical protein